MANLREVSVKTAVKYLLLLLVLLGLLSYTLHKIPCLREKATIETKARSRVNIEGLTGRAHQLTKVRSFDGRTLTNATHSCQPYTSESNCNCERWIVVSTINHVTDILRKISSLKGWCMVRVTNNKGPALMNIPNVDCLEVIQQESCEYRICKLIPWNHFGRKNIGYMYAVQHGAKLVYDTDDDHEPLASIVPEFDEPYSRHMKVPGYLWNPYPAFGPGTNIWPRGFPLSRIIDNSTKTAKLSGRAAEPQVGVVQFLAQHDPDVDATYRLTKRLPYNFNTKTRRLVVPHRVFSPYNAQATLHSQDAFWGMLLPISVHGRVSDIWRSYFTQRLLWDIGKHVAFNSPFVVQYRNPHNYLADFESEMDLYYKTENLVKFLLEWMPDTSSSLQQRLFDLHIQLYEYGFIEADDVALTEAWIQDLQCLGYIFPTVLLS